MVGVGSIRFSRDDVPVKPEGFLDVILRRVLT